MMLANTAPATKKRDRVRAPQKTHGENIYIYIYLAEFDLCASNELLQATTRKQSTKYTTDCAVCPFIFPI